MGKSVLGTALKITAGVVAAAGTAAAVSLVYGLKKWAEDETSQEIKFTTGGKNGVCISKTDDGKYIVDTKYDWASDPAFADVAEAYLLTQLERGFSTLDFYKSLRLS